jgi:putative ABC transport system substrate-binding protein
MKRREFISGLMGAAAWPLAAQAQQPAMPVIGFLHSASSAAYARYVAAFNRALEKMGLLEGQNMRIEYRWANDRYDQLPALAADLVRHQVAVIVAIGPPAAQVAKAATTTIPIVFAVGADPIASGLVGTLNRPGGNLTGASILINTLAPKQLEILHQVLPKTAAIGALLNPDNPNAETDAREVTEAARAPGRPLILFNARNESDIDATFGALARQNARGLVVVSDPSALTRGDQVIALSARHAIATIYPVPEQAAAGGLMSYGVSLTDSYDLLASYTRRILKGERPADLPVQQATKIELVINMRTAKALGLTIPETLLATADKVIE